eukprot:Phypoly_transcript_06356.p1 GENE.Phypoly_transcript_06356~~Phypoly_transcript_06356.p1  ORF type:complete len:404 (+),score=67.21 Phypoly_transcript_06356:59-1270(+)
MLLNFSNFQLREKCGEGDGGVVWKALKKDDALVCAVKILRAPLHEIAKDGQPPKEAQIMEALSTPGHPNLVKYYGWGKIFRDEMISLDKEKMYCCFPGEVGAFIVMEYVEGMPLEHKLAESTFGRNKRRHIFKQLLQAIQYMHSCNISHSSLFLNNLIISKPENSISFLPKLVVCDFGAALQASKDTGPEDMIFDLDLRQCGGVLLALFSSMNLNVQTITNKFMQKEALELARDLIDVRKPLSIEEALKTPFLTESMAEDKFMSPTFAMWNDEIVENIASHIIRTGDVKDFSNASLVCKQFFVVFQRLILCTPQFPHLSKEPGYPYELALDAKVEEVCMYFQRMNCTADFSVLRDYSDGDLEFEGEMLASFLEGAVEHATNAESIVISFTETDHPWRDVSFFF